jgi:3-oxoacyl-[acyl-carrier protein] reductase
VSDARVAVVTGAGKGIGRAAAVALARTGARVAVVFRSDPEAAHAAVREIAADGGEAFAQRADVTVEEDVVAMFDAVVDRWGRVDVLVNNAGVAEPAALTEISLEQWERTLHGNLTSAFLCTRAAVPIMQRQRYGRIVNVASQAGRTGGRTGPHYAAAKAGVIAFTQSVARAHASDGITVNAVAPNYTETGLLDRMGVSAQRESIAATLPIGRFAQPEEVAAVIRFLCGEDASYVTGECVGITGGM